MKFLGIGIAVMVSMMVLTPMLLARIASRRRPRLGRVGGAVTLRMPRGHWAVLGTLAAVPCAAFSALAFLTEWRPGAESSGLVLGTLMGLLGIAGAGTLYLFEIRGRLVLDDVGLTRIGPLGQVRAAWGDVRKVTFNPVNNWFFLTLASGHRVYVTEGLEGIADFAELALAHLPRPVLEASPEAAEELRDLEKTYR
ncbi:MAG: PH domain-containing protein [Deltaproteobacteria bacterium]|nr:PH domain-containing protein [Deltaproteobacteria bacterium]